MKNIQVGVAITVLFASSLAGAVPKLSEVPDNAYSSTPNEEQQQPLLKNYVGDVSDQLNKLILDRKLAKIESQMRPVFIKHSSNF